MRRLTVMLAVGLGLALTACGVPEDSSPQELSAEEVPFGLLSTPPTTTTTPLNLPPNRAAQLYFLDADNRLVPVTNEVENRQPATILMALLATQPTDIRTGLMSAIPPDTGLLGATRDEDDVLTVDLSNEFTSIQGERSIAAVAQIVYTMTDPGLGITGVLFQIEGEDFTVSDQDGAQQEGPVDRADYATTFDPVS
jgi:spore germination protein GerM